MKHQAVLPFDMDALEPHISKETLEYHHGRHHQAYANNLNKMIVGTEFENMSLINIIRKSEGGILNNAAQLWNHTFYWNCVAPGNNYLPAGAFGEALLKEFGSLADFIDVFKQAAARNFGSGWTWLVKRPTGELAIVNTSNEGCVLTEGYTPLLVCDVWEHAYYIDYRNERGAYLENFCELINWSYVAANYEA